MNAIQKSIVIVSLAISAGMVAFPPWVLTTRFPGMLINKGYGFIAKPPGETAKINIGTLSVQLLFVAVVSSGLVVLFRSKIRE